MGGTNTLLVPGSQKLGGPVPPGPHGGCAYEKMHRKKNEQKCQTDTESQKQRKRRKVINRQCYNSTTKETHTEVETSVRLHELRQETRDDEGDRRVCSDAGATEAVAKTERRAVLIVQTPSKCKQR